MCREFKLPHSGNKTQLKARLKAFSADRKGWDRYVPFPSLQLLARIFSAQLHLRRIIHGARRKHKGPRPGPKKTTAKKSIQRREQLMNGRESSPTVIRHALPTQRSKDLRTAEQIAQFIPWVSVFLPFIFRSPFCSLTYFAPTGPDHCFDLSLSTSRSIAIRCTPFT
jgi:hypothetical protein